MTKSIDLEPLPLERQFRVHVSAAKARGYFVEAGRGLLITEPEAGPYAHWLSTHAPGSRCYRNRYITLADLRATNCPATVVDLVEAYDPHTEAVVVIRFDAADHFEPHVVSLKLGTVGSSRWSIDDEDLPF